MGLAVPLGGVKQRAVLALLALDVGEVVPLDRLVDELWHDDPPEHATLGLQSYISRLRRLLARAAGEPDRSMLVTRAPGWCLTAPPEAVDAYRFDELASRARAALRRAAPAEAYTAATEALGLWHGAALADLTELATSAAVEQLEQTRLAVAEDRLDAQLGLGLTPEAVTEASRLTELHPYRERLWGALILALYRSGRQADALSTFARVRSRLADDLGIDPGAELNRLHERVLRQDPALNEASGVAPPPVAIPAQSGAPPDDSPRLVGREAAIRILDGVVADMGLGRGRLVLVEGPAGMGKTALIDEMVRRVSAAGGRVARGAGVEGDAAPALWPWVGVLRALTKSATGTAAALLTDPATSRMFQAIDPSLARADAAEGGGDPVLARTRLYRAYVDLLQAVAAQGPLLVVLDDAHWLDADSAALLRVVVEDLGTSPLTVLLARRPSNEAEDPSPELLGRGARTSALHVLLDGLRPEHVAAMASDVLGHPCDPGVASALYARTAGNPLFVRELVRLLVSERRLDEEGVRSALPVGVREVLQQRLDRLPRQTRSLLAVASVLGRRADTEVLEQVAGLDPAALLDACEPALAVGMLTEDPGDPGAFRLSHDLVRQTLYESLSLARRYRLHATAAAVLEHAQRPGGTSELVRHLTLAGPAVDGHKVVAYLLQNAAEAEAAHALDQAATGLRRALDLAEQLSDDQGRRQADAARARLGVLTSMNRGFAADATAEFLRVDDVALADGALADDDGLAGWFGRQTARLCRCEFGAVEAAAGDLDRPGVRPAVPAAARLLAGIAALSVGACDRAARHLSACERHLAEAPDMGPLKAFGLRGVAAISLGLAAHLDDDEPGADREIARGLRLAEDEDSVFGQVFTRYTAAWVAASRGNPATAAEHAAVVGDLDSRYGFALYAAFSRVYTGWAQAMQGAPVGCTIADGAHESLLSTGTIQGRSLVLMLRAEAWWSVGDHERARELAAVAREHSRVTGERLLGKRLTKLQATLLQN